MDLDHRKMIRNNAKFHTAQCFPFNAMMNALGVTHIDYFSLDIEGPELQVLKTINFDRVSIDVMTIEYRVINLKGVYRNHDLSEMKLQNIRDFFNTKLKGVYTEVGIITKHRQFIVHQNHNYREIARKTGMDIVFKRM